ncbi:3-phosphoshikimate 1-carboxyvinyltransferase, partial [Lactobacillaceae bacterium KNUT 0156]|nr:3-phosphoshikimate 1-carboxyvinyltransferase [Weissella cibaria]
VNETRSGILKVLRRMGANITLMHKRLQNGESIADIRVRSADMLIGTTIAGMEVPTMIDELPILALALAVAQGDSRVLDASELRIKESNRIVTVTKTLQAFGAQINETPDGFVIAGVDQLQAPNQPLVDYDDHRIAMLQAVAKLLTSNVK